MKNCKNTLAPARTRLARSTRDSRGFTLLEIMVVVVILGILAALVAPNVIRRIDDARVTKAKQDIRAYETALNLYRMDNFRYPTTEQGLEALVKQPTDPEHQELEAGRLHPEPAQGSVGQRLPVHLAGLARRLRPLHPRRRRPAGWRGPRCRSSATGTAINTSRRRPAAAAASGFTLLEVLVVIIIIGIITSMAMISVKVLGGDHEMDKEAARLQAILLQSREDAMLVGTDVGMRVDLHGYDFLRYDSRKETWQPVTDDPMLRARALPEGMTATLRIEGRDVVLKQADEAKPLLKEGEEPVQPQVVVQASGDLVPFDVVLQRDGTAGSPARRRDDRRQDRGARRCARTTVARAWRPRHAASRSSRCWRRW